jgi:hypothetical protein
VFGDTAIIIDGIAPFRWMNPNAPTNWMADVELQLTLGDSFINETKIEAMGRGNFEWNIFEVTQKKKDSFIHRHGLSWDKPHFDCPVCVSNESILSELAVEDLYKGEVKPNRLLCTHCNFSVGDFSKDSVLEGYEPILCNVLLRDQIRRLKNEEIIEWLSGFGSDFAGAIAKLR